MAGASLLTLLDDIASVLDDVAVMSKVAAKKTAGVLGDDLALNAQQVAGVNADRELPVVWAVAVGSLKNKAILVPAALLISAFMSWAIVPLLMIGGAYLCFEGFEKIWHSLAHGHAAAESQAEPAAPVAVDLVAFEQDKIKGAIRTDFILSAEIIVIALGTVAGEPLLKQVLVLVAVAAVMTVGVYGAVAGIVKLDDAGLHLSQKTGESAGRRLQRSCGRVLLRAAPYLMKVLSVVGTAAMFLVGGGILTHGLPGAHEQIHAVAHAVEAWPLVGGLLAAIVPTLLDGLAGILAGALVLLLVSGVTKIFRR